MLAVPSLRFTGSTMMPPTSPLPGCRSSVASRRSLSLSTFRLSRIIVPVFCMLIVLSPALGAYAAPSSAAKAIPLHGSAYVIINSANGYEIMAGDGVDKDRRIARVKVDSISDVSAQLSTDATQVAFRVTGDRLGGSSLYNVSVETGDYANKSPKTHRRA